MPQSVDPSSPEDILALEDPINISSHESNTIFVEKIGFVVLLNREKNITHWVYECLTDQQVKTDLVSRNDGKDIGKIEVDPHVGTLTSAEYKNWPNIYQKGHLAAAANHKYNFKAYCNTFIHYNCVPMFPNVNVILCRLEKEARIIAREKGKVHIITMPYFIPEKKPNYVRKDSRVRIPDAIIKVIVEKHNKDPNKYFVVAYFVKNSPGGLKEMMYFRDLEYLGWKFLSAIPVENIIDGSTRKKIRKCIPWIKTKDLLAFIKQRDSNNSSDAHNPEVDDNHVPNRNLPDVDNHPDRRIIRYRGQ